ncbi:MAG: Holliday junction resolvase RuvX [Acidobacteria bacterium]|nr:Holliday junction resolvase RuvX [Acidobacteriota bacterium]MBI3654978.1 Holliday junction resolvase RuvX [Acidobacteriota bacterium]
MALDYGTVRIGVAISDERRILARPLQTIKVQGWKKDRETLRALLAEHSVTEIVVGLPLNMDGSVGVAAKRVERFMNRLRGVFKLPVVAHDERLSSVAAAETLSIVGVRRGRRKGLMDAVSAAHILQEYLDQCSKEHRPV